jgi:ATP-dependent DNA helicase DinG
MAAMLERFVDAEPEEETVLWIERRDGGAGGPWVALHATPLDIRPLMREAVFTPYETVVMTSATLAVNGDFQFWGGRIGVPFGTGEVLQGRFESPFDYPSRVLFAVPEDAPFPESPHYSRYLREIIPRLVNAGDGGALVLFTSYRQLEEIYAETAPLLERRGFSCYRQGSDDRVRLLEQFRADVASVLFATDSFWEGVDVPGHALRMVILCRLPFRVPTDPVQLARAEAVEKDGGNAFAEFSLPQAVMRLKQGFGRLMRRVDDYGVVVVTDPRMIRKSYGRVFWNSMPPATPLTAPGETLVEEVQSFLARFRGDR